MRQKKLTIKEFCEEYKVSRRHLYRLWTAKKGPKKKHSGNRVIISEKDAEDWYEALPNERAAA